MKETFISVPVFNIDEPIIVHHAGVSYCDGSYHIVRQNSDIACFEYVISGCGTIEKGDTKLHPQKGDTYFLLPHEYHNYYSNEKNPWIKIWINVSGPLVTSLVDAYSLREHNVITCDTESYFRQIHRVLKNTDYTPTEMSRAIAMIFHSLIQFLSGNIIKDNITDDAVILKNYIDTNIYKTITIDELSTTIYKSPSQTIRIFKKAFNTTPYDYHMSCRINKAVSMLCDTHYAVKDIAMILGFCDEHYFSNIFKAKTGKSPSKYRK